MTGTLIGVRLQPGLLSVIDRWVAHYPEPRPSRPEAIRLILRDWAFSQGLAPTVASAPASEPLLHIEPASPCPDAVDQMHSAAHEKAE
jgi:hypothetical protein